MLTRLRRWPVASRMLVSALVLVLVVLPLAGTVLAWNFRQTLSQSFDERLLSFLNVVIAGIESDPETGELTRAHNWATRALNRCIPAGTGR